MEYKRTSDPYKYAPSGRAQNISKEIKVINIDA
jgi:hypothetical protein